MIVPAPESVSSLSDASEDAAQSDVRARNREAITSGNEILTTAELVEARALWGPRVGIAVMGLNGGGVAGFEGRGSPYAWSTTKLLIVAQILRDVGGPEALTDQQRFAIELAITESDNDAAAELNAELKSRHSGPTSTAQVLTEMLRDVGDPTTTIEPGREANSNYGLSVWEVQAQAAFMSALARGCVLDDDSTDYLLTTMGRVIDEQAWGLGAIGADAFKGGWGAKTGETAFEVRQVGVVRAANGNPYVLAIAAWPQEESYLAGQVLVEEVARWVAGKVVAAPQASGCFD